MQLQHIQEVTLDLNTNTAYTTVGVKQADERSRILRVHITENGIDWNIPEGVHAQYRVRKPDGHAVWNRATIQNNTVLIELSQQALASSGRAYADIVFIHGTGSNRIILSTVSFILIIMAAPDITKQVVSTSEFGELIDLAESAETIIYESEAWARGTRNGVPVVSEYFGYDIETDNIAVDITINPNIFRNFFGENPGESKTYTFECTTSNDNNQPNGGDGGIWALTYDDIEITNIVGIGELQTQPIDTVTYTIPNLTSCGFNIQPNGISPIRGTRVIVTVTDQDLQYHNNAKYWSDYSYTAKESIENLTVGLTVLDEDKKPSLDKNTIQDITITLESGRENYSPEFEVVLTNEFGQEDSSKFIERIGGIAGDYRFVYDAENQRWDLDGSYVIPDIINARQQISNRFGFTINLSSDDSLYNNDAFVIHYNTHEHIQFNLPRGLTGKVNIATFDINVDPGAKDEEDNPIPFGALCLYKPKFYNPELEEYVTDYDFIDDFGTLLFDADDGFLNVKIKIGG